MPSLADLHRAVQSTLAGKRLGTPVFVRYHLQSRDKATALPRRLAQTVDVVRAWLGRPLERVYALGSPRSGQVSLTLEFRGGPSAVVSWAAGEPRGDGVDLTVIGNHGALYHDAGAANLWDDPAAPAAEPPAPATLAAVERALRSGRPETVEKGDGG
jgi:hypothetical protein